MVLLPGKNFLQDKLAQVNSSKKPTDKQQKIFAAAVRLFAEKGYANTSTSEIAKAAGVAEGTIFRHYGTKDQLLMSIIITFIRSSFPAIAESVFQEIDIEKHVSFESFLKALILNRIEFIKENREIFQVFAKEVLYHERLRNELAPYFKKNVVGRILPLIERFKEQGELVDWPAEKILFYGFSQMAGYFAVRFLILSDDVVEDDAAEAEALVRFVMDGLRKRPPDLEKQN